MLLSSRFARLAIGIALLVAARIHAGAQAVSVYGTFSPVRVSNVVTGNTVGLNSTYTTGSFWASGVGGGVTLSPVHLGPLSLGLDVRGSAAPQAQGADTLLVGVKAGLKLFGLRPYVQGSGGYLGARATITNGAPGIQGTSPDQEYWIYEVLGGVDYNLIPHLDLRVAEIGGGQGFYKSGPNSNKPDVSILTINTGIVVHF